VRRSESRLHPHLNQSFRFANAIGFHQSLVCDSRSPPDSQSGIMDGFGDIGIGQMRVCLCTIGGGGLSFGFCGAQRSKFGPSADKE